MKKEIIKLLKKTINGGCTETTTRFGEGSFALVYEVTCPKIPSNVNVIYDSNKGKNIYDKETTIARKFTVKYEALKEIYAFEILKKINETFLLDYYILYFISF